MAVTIREVTEHDLDRVLALNNAAGPGILPVDLTRIRILSDNAAYFRVAEIDGVLGGFLIALRPDAQYESLNFQWFQSRYPDFVYIDRIVIGRPYRGIGLGRVFYADVQSFAEAASPQLTCEVFLDPARRRLGPVPRHLRVPRSRAAGAAERAPREPAGEGTVQLPYVRDTYWNGPSGGLPAQPWLAERRRRDPSQRIAASGSESHTRC
jgi:predicted GNAT superfamily acetyltransferase